jgi:hypothetical protein
MFSSKTAFTNHGLVLQIKLAFLQKNHICFKKPHVDVLGLARGGVLTTKCTHGKTFIDIQSTMMMMKTMMTTTMLRDEASWTTSTACG